MAGTFQIISFTGTLKSLAANYFPRVLGAAGAWESSNANSVTVNDYLVCTKNREILLLDNNNDVSIKFVADTGGDDGQGIRIPLGFKEVNISTLSGTVRILTYDNQNVNTEIEDAYGNPNYVTAAAKDVVYPGDIVCCSKTSNFTLAFDLESTVKYQRVGLDIVALSSEKVV